MYLLIGLFLILNIQGEGHTDARNLLLRNLRMPHECKLMTDKSEADFKGHIQGSFAGCAYSLYIRGKKKASGYLGMAELNNNIRTVNEDTYFDLASLTKPLCTAPLILEYAAKGKLSLNNRIDMYFKELKGSPSGKASLSDLLTHTGGYPSHYKFFRYNMDRNALFDLLNGEKRLNRKYKYGDLGYMLLGMLIEKISKKPLNEEYKQRITEPLGINLSFTPPKDAEIASTQACLWRSRDLVAGELHDENAWFWGVPCGHAGLWGRESDVSDLLLALLGYTDKRVFSPFTLKYLISSSGSKAYTTHGFKYYKAAKSGRLSKSTIWHTGYTGTAIWLDPNEEISIVLLTNSLHPAYYTNINQLRRQFAETILQD